MKLKILLATCFALILGSCVQKNLSEERALRHTKKSTYRLSTGTGFCTAFNVKYNNRKTSVTAGHCCTDLPEDMIAFTSDAPDICVFKEVIFKTSEYIKLTDKPIRTGEKVFSVGYPRSIGPFLYEGRISHVFKDQTWATISFIPGQSGSALVNEKGELIGIFSKYFTVGTNMTIITPQKQTTDIIKKVLTQTKK